MKAPARARMRWVLRVVLLGLMMGTLTVALNRMAASWSEAEGKAGFWSGVIHGALMPVALPSLALGKEVEIYAQRNSGRTYKLGYTAGVNLSGAAFFGLLYRRMAALRNGNGNRRSG